MDLRQLEILKAVADTGSFTGAGRRLHVSQSAVSRQILLLEAELNEPLFWRIKRKVKITPAGEALLQLAIRVFDDINETTARITETQEKLTGTVRLVGGMTVSLYVFPTLLKEFRRLHPEVDVKVMTGSTDRLLRRLRVRRGRPRAAHAAHQRARPHHAARHARRADAGDLPRRTRSRKKERVEPQELVQAAVHPLRAGLQHAPRDRRVLHPRAGAAADRDGDGERRDHQGDGRERDRNHAHLAARRRA